MSDQNPRNHPDIWEDFLRSELEYYWVLGRCLAAHEMH